MPQTILAGHSQWAAPPRVNVSASNRSVDKNRSPIAGRGAGEELLPGAHGSSGFGLVTQRLIDLSAPRADSQTLPVGVHRTTAQIGVDDTGALASLGDRGDHQRLADASISAGVDAPH